MSICGDCCKSSNVDENEVKLKQEQEQEQQPKITEQLQLKPSLETLKQCLYEYSFIPALCKEVVKAEDDKPALYFSPDAINAYNKSNTSFTWKTDKSKNTIKIFDKNKNRIYVHYDANLKTDNNHNEYILMDYDSEDHLVVQTKDKKLNYGIGFQELKNQFKKLQQQNKENSYKVNEIEKSPTLDDYQGFEEMTPEQLKEKYPYNRDNEFEKFIKNDLDIFDRMNFYITITDSHNEKVGFYFDDNILEEIATC